MNKGKTFCFMFPIIKRKMIVTGDSKISEYILKEKFKDYEKGDSLKRNLHIFLGDGIFNSDGEIWKNQRRIASHMFSTKNLKIMTGVFINHAKELIKVLDNNENKVVDIQEYFQRFTIDSFGEIGFGVNIDSLNNDNNEFAKNFKIACLNSSFRFFWVFWEYTPFLNSERELKKSIEYLNKFAFDMIQKRKMEKEIGNNNDLISEYLNQKDSNYSDNDLRDLVMNFLLAGRDTTAQTLTWGIYEIFQEKNNHVIKRIRKELEEKYDSEEKINFENLKSKDYLDLVIMEILRLHPPVSLDPKEAIKDDILPGF